MMETEVSGGDDDECGLAECYRVLDLPASAWYVPEWVSREEEAALLRGVYGAPRPKWTQLSGRRLQNWGGLPTARGMLAERLPGWLARPVRDVAARRALGPGAPAPNHVLVNEYRPGQGILPHVDGELFHPAVATLSLGAHTVLRLADTDTPARGLLLEPRSLVVLRDALYTRHKHYIEERTHDVADGSLANLALCGAPPAPGARLERGTRVSLTIRHVPRTSTFKLSIGNKT